MHGGQVILGVTLAVWGIGSSAVRAEGIIRKVPADGSWVEFKLNMSITDDDTPNEMLKVTGKVRLSFVGTKTEGDKKLHWLEIDSTLEPENVPRKKHTVLKLLIPEEELQEGKYPNEHIVRGWEKDIREDRDTEPRELSLKEGRPLDNGISLFLVGPLGESKKLEPQVIESKLGKQECAGVTGNFAISVPQQQESRDFRGRLEIFTHDKAPWGVVSYRTLVEQPGNDKIDLKLVLSDFGDDAKSKLPEQE